MHRTWKSHGVKDDFGDGRLYLQVSEAGISTVSEALVFCQSTGIISQLSCLGFSAHLKLLGH